MLTCTNVVIVHVFVRALCMHKDLWSDRNTWRGMEMYAHLCVAVRTNMECHTPGTFHACVF